VVVNANLSPENERGPGDAPGPQSPYGRRWRSLRYRRRDRTALGDATRKPRAAVQSVVSCAGLYLDKLVKHFQPLGSGEPGDGFLLGFDPQTALALLACRYRDVADNSIAGRADSCL
jgi:hypothetical protein